MDNDKTQKDTLADLRKRVTRVEEKKASIELEIMQDSFLDELSKVAASRPKEKTPPNMLGFLTAGGVGALLGPVTSAAAMAGYVRGGKQGRQAEGAWTGGTGATVGSAIGGLAGAAIGSLAGEEGIAPGAALGALIGGVSGYKSNMARMDRSKTKRAGLGSAFKSMAEGGPAAHKAELAGLGVLGLPVAHELHKSIKEKNKGGVASSGAELAGLGVLSAPAAAALMRHH